MKGYKGEMGYGIFSNGVNKATQIRVGVEDL